MSEPVSALDGATRGANVTVRAAGPRGMITLRGDLSSHKLGQAVTAATGATVPGIRGMTSGAGGTVAWMAPDELLLMMEPQAVAGALSGIENALAGEHFLAVDVSDARAMFEISGAGVREVIAKLCPVDMAPGRFEPGELRRTRMAQVPAAVWMADPQTIRVICFRSVAGYVSGLLEDAAAPGGVVGYFG